MDSNFTADDVLTALKAHGSWMTTRAVVSALGSDPDKSEDRMAAISALSRLEEKHSVEMQFPNGKPTLWRALSQNLA